MEPSESARPSSAVVDLSDDYIKRYLAEEPPLPLRTDERILDRLDGLKKEIAELRRELRDARPYTPGLAELQHGMAGLTVRMSVLLHQMRLGFEGKPLTASADAFAPDEPAAGARTRHMPPRS